MKLHAMDRVVWRVHKGWVIRAALVLSITCLIDGLVVGFATTPLVWAALIPGTLPLTMWLFVAMPVWNEAKNTNAG